MDGASIGVDHRVRRLARPDAADGSAGRPYGSAAVGGGMPAVPNGHAWRDPFLDRVGTVVHDNRRALAVVAALGAAGGALTGHRLLGRVVHAMAGAIAAPAFAGAALLLAGRGGRLDGYEAAGQEGAAGVGRVAQPVRRPEDLRVMTFNIREGIGPTGEHTLDTRQLAEVALTIQRERPDIVMLQEVSDFSLLSGWHDQVRVLEERLRPDDLAFAGAGTRATGKTKGQLVLTFNGATIEDAQVLHHEDRLGHGLLRRIGSLAGHWVDRNPEWSERLPKLRGYFGRATLDTVVRTPAGNELRVLDAHLSGTGRGSGGTPGRFEAQVQQLDALLPTLRAWDGPTILAGDFNVKSASAAGAREREVLGTAGLVDAFVAAGVTAGHPSRRTYPSTGPRSDIDRIYASRQIEVRRVQVVPDARPDSDHFAVVADLHITASS